MEDRRVTIKDIAEELGLSTATVSNVIHGKTKKISDRTVSKVQEQLEKSGYIPNMAAVLLAQNSSRIVCVLLSDDVKYDGKMLEDPFVNGILNGLSKELKKKDYFMMVREEKDMNQIIAYASMWNMAGLILIGYCQQDYESLRSKMHIPFVVLDAYTTNVHHFSDIGLKNITGGMIAGEYLIQKGHRKIMYLADNKEDGCDYDRYVGLTKELQKAGIEYSESDYQVVSMNKEERFKDYQVLYQKIFKEEQIYSAAFCASDVYAIEFMNYLQDMGKNIPEQFSIIGFDDILMAECVRPKLTTIRQDLRKRAEMAVQLLEELIDGKETARTELLSLTLVERESVWDRNK